MHQWSTTPLNNQTADSRAQWQEGQPASSLNNSARGLMATAAFWRDDNLGVSLTAVAGSSNVYSLTTGQGLIDPATVSSTPAITHAFSLRVTFATTPTGIATNPLKLAIDGAAAATVTRADGSALVDGDITAGKSYPIVGYAFSGGALSQIRVISILPSEVNALADARVNAALPAIIASIGSPVQKTGDTMTGRLNFAPTATNSLYSYTAQFSNANAAFAVRNGNGRLQIIDDAGAVEYFSVGTDGTLSTRQLGDLNSRIESRGSAWADNAVNRANGYTNGFVSSIRWVFVGDQNVAAHFGSGTFEDFGGSAVTGRSTSLTFRQEDIIITSLRWRQLQIYIPNAGWVATYFA
jgi:hypothetical protein